uniref:RNase H type-1 domain-containing protein n=1 Tax=Fagus sylvatica TaxID=28930 RepID=A0A2N9GCE4_FAGSY
MNENRLVFVFEDEADREKVMMGEPWAYDKHLIILQRIEEEEAIEDVVFRETSLWIQLHGLPVRRMTPKVANTLVSSLGRIEQISDGDTNADGGQAMRIRVRLDVTKPLCRGRKARLEKGRETWISFKYERLPNFCYWCGLLSHSDKDYPKWLLNKDELRAEDQQFGPWLRVVNEHPWRKTEIKVEGICRPPNRKQPKPPSTQTANPTVRHHPPPPNPNTRLNKPHHPNPPQITLPTMLNHPHLQKKPMSHRLYFPITQPPRRWSTTCQMSMTAGMPTLSVSNSLPPTPTPITHAPAKSPLVLGDITNTVQSHPNNTKSQMGKKSWKRLARANGEQFNTQSGITQGKRLSSSMEEEVLLEAGMKKQRGTFYDPISDDGPLERLRCQLQFANKFIVKSRNKGGGLCLLWKNEVKLRVQSFSHSHIDAFVIRVEEKQGRLSQLENQMQRFRDVLDDCGFIDLGYSGPSYTWTNNRVGDMTWERLDKAVATSNWLMLFPTAKVHHLEGCWSDHKQILVARKQLWPLGRQRKLEFPCTKCGIKFIHAEKGFGCGAATALIENVVEGIPRVVTPDMNQHLTRDFVPLEVIEAVKQMSPTKAPGPDGLPPVLKRILPQIVSESQSAFVLERLITDNILVAFETLHHMHQQRKGKFSSVALKLDMKGLHSLLQRAKNAGDIHGVSISRSGPKLTHLFFADDSLLFCKATTNEIRCIQDILTEYELALGQTVNRQKTTLFFSYSTPWHTKDNIQAILGVPIIQQYERFWWGQGGERGKMHWLPWDSLYQAKNSGGLGFQELDAQLNAWSSFAWKSIMGAREVIKKGSIWRIGNGEHIRIWGERWLPVAHHHTIISPRSQQTTVTHVAHLIDQDTRSWDTAVVKANFLPFEAEIILGILLCNTRNEDMLIWGGTRAGHYANRQRLNQPTDEIDRLYPRALELLTEFHQAQDNHSQTTHSNAPSARTKWKPPISGRYKVNFDGAIFAETNEAGLGAIIRNHWGEVMASLCQRIPYPHSVAAVEASAARTAVNLILELGFREVDIEGDSLEIINALLQNSPCFTLYGHLITDTSIIAQNLNSFQFMHVKRDGNTVAHSLAKRARHCEPFEVWMESVPPDLRNILSSDFSLI